MSNKFEVKSSKFKILVAVDLSAFFCYIKTMATWRSGYAEVCKTSYAGSIPAVASKIIFVFL